VVPVAFAVSILRHRLWDIDIILGRAFVYSGLMAIVGGIYVASMTLSQRVFVALFGAPSDATLVMTTLAFAALLAPLRNALERITRRYMAARPEANQVLHIFRDQVRTFVDVMDVRQLTANALDAAMAAFGAQTGAVYLRQEHRFQLVHERGDWNQVEGLSAWLDDPAGDKYGWIVLGPSRRGRCYTSEDEALLASIARTVAHAIGLIDTLHAGVTASVKAAAAAQAE
jgi:hypothetical protein